MNFTDYAEKAIHRYGLTGYNNLARELGLNKASVSFFRSGRALPSEETMIKLAELAGMPKEEALIDLNLWRSKNNPELQKVWLRLSKLLGCLLILSVIDINDVKACSEMQINSCNLNKIQPVVYIMRQMDVVLKKIITTITRFFKNAYFMFPCCMEYKA